MAYITDADFYTVITPDVLTEIVAASSITKEAAIEMAKSQAADYLHTKYDTEALFAKEGAERHKTLLMYVIDMCLYHLHAGLSGRNIPELRQKRYDDAIKWLEKVNTGKIAPKDFPQPDDDPNDNAPGIWGMIDSLPKFNSSY